jgi:hypothetical protein
MIHHLSKMAKHDFVSLGKLFLGISRIKKAVALFESQKIKYTL